MDISNPISNYQSESTFNSNYWSELIQDSSQALWLSTKAKILLKFFYMVGFRKLEEMDTFTR